ncbi:hypothetical protein WA026_023548 [Henosepilachna vigintioctopunctata]|uniref:Peptidoglycan-recognition protein n=1 Tax=Henosepilachna vigintioctopunctata TaxID=420089 RepID=A0AAW1UH76_9CUCU
MGLLIKLFYIFVVLANSYLCLPTKLAKSESHLWNATGLNIISRVEWLAKESTEASTTLGLPVPYVIIAHTATQSCFSQIRCSAIVRNIQTYHVNSSDFIDIGYNFLIGGAGDVYLGRGWENEGAHTKGYNAISVGIAFIGDFQHCSPTDSQIAACKKLIKQGVEAGFIKKQYKLLGARQLRNTQSPGDKLFNEIKMWENWVEKPE